MPFEIKKFKNGFRVCKVNEDKCFSKKPLSKKQAVKQLKAIGMSGGSSPTFQEYLKQNYPEYVNLEMQGTRKVGNNSWETIVKDSDKKFFDKEAYDKLMKGAMTRSEWEELKKIRGNRMQKSYDEYIKQVEDISRARSTRNLSAEERSGMDKANMDTKNEIYKQYLQEYPDMQKVMCNVKGEDRVAPYETTKGQCMEEHKKYDRRGVFGKITGALTDVADWAVENIADKLPVVGQIASEVYKVAPPPTSKYYTGSGIPKNKKLYNEIKQEVYKKQPKHSLYRSARIIKMYKDKGGKFRESKSPQMNIPKWFKQDWIDIGAYLEGKIKKCGSVDYKDKYPLCRPKKLVEKLTAEQLEKMLDEKQKLKEKPLITEKVLGTDKFNIKPTLSGTGFKTYLKEVQKVSPIKYLKLVKENGVKNGYKADKIKWATDGKHKFTYNGVGFGALKYNDYLLWKLKEGDKVAELKRNNYRKRAERVMTESNDKFSPASLSYYILW